jgi:hypothetical protein
MRINYEQVAALLQDEKFKQIIRRFWLEDLQNALHSKTVGVSVVFLCFAICAEPGTNLETMEIKDPDREFADFIKTNREYVTEIYKRVLDFGEFIGGKR